MTLPNAEALCEAVSRPPCALCRRKPMSNGPLMLVRMRERLVVDGFDGERKLYRQRLQDVYKRLTSYHSCEGATFAFVGDWPTSAGNCGRSMRRLRNLPPTIAKCRRQPPNSPGKAVAVSAAQVNRRKG